MRLNTPAQQRRVEAFRVLYALNAKGLLRSYDERTGRGFADARVSPPRVCGGLSKFLKSVTPAMLARQVDRCTEKGAAISRRRTASFDSQTRTASSSKHRGTNVHRAIHHALLCGEKRCRCGGGVPTSLSAGEQQMLNGARAFLKQNNMRMLACEQVIVSPSDSPQRVGTRFDALVQRNIDAQKQEECVALVSWKTGGQYLYEEELHGRNKRALANRAKRERNKHVAQVLAEAALLRREHGIQVDEAYIVYLLSTPSTTTTSLVPMYRVVHIARSALEAPRNDVFWNAMVKHSVQGKW
jgi:hypothetical protein